jgi:O-antigen ligase
VSKSSFLNNSLLQKSNIACVCILAMFIGFLVNQVALSISMFFFCINALRGVHPRRWLQNKWWLIGIAWLLVIVVSYFWSEDKAHWERAFQVKLPLLLFPVACGFMPPLSVKQLERLTLLIGLALFCGVCYSMSFLITQPQKYLLEYRWSVLLPTPCSQDHVRFSMSLALFIIWSVFLWPWLGNRAVKAGVAAFSVLFVVYLHVLAAKSGLVALYAFLVAWGIYIAVAKKKLAGLLIILGIPILLFTAVKCIPTLSERKDYISYAWTMLREGDRSGKYGDVNRLMSYKLAFHIMGQHPWLGVGAGDVLQEMKKGYDEFYPQVEDKARLLPHNQFLLEGVGCGIPAMLLFAVWVFYPLTWLRRSSPMAKPGRQRFFFFIVWLLLLSQLLIEPVLEVQYGVFVYLFFLLWQWQQMPERPSATPTAQASA